MINIICDMCKKSIPNARRDINYFTARNRALCVTCYDEFLQEVNSMMNEVGVSQNNSVKFENYSFGTYKEVFRDTLEELCK